MSRVLLTSSAGPNVRFKVLSAPLSVQGTGNEGIPAGALTAAAGWKPLTEFAKSWKDVSKQLYVDNSERKFNAQALLVKDIFPRYGDLPGAWVSQHGEHNWVKMEVNEIHDANSITIWETLNPGGVSEVTLSNKEGASLTVYQSGWSSATNAVQPSGANEMTIQFRPVGFDVTYVYIKVDASEKWRGIDAFTITGFERQDATIPGEISGNALSFAPNVNKPYGCDEIQYAANAGDGWSAPGTLRFCYNCPRDAAGTLCSGRGTCSEAKCSCSKGWAGLACDRPLCPLYNGRMCSDRGSCEGTTCSCPAGYQGAACETAGRIVGCSACNDPHYTSFWGRRFDLYVTGEWLLHWWPGMSGKTLQVNMFVYQLFVDGGSVRYGSDIVTWRWRGYNSLMVNCQAVGAGSHRTASGMVAYLDYSYMRVEIGNWFRYEMNTGCFSLTTMSSQGQAFGMCNDATAQIPGGCSLFTCQKCGADEVLSFVKKQESITPSGKKADHGLPLTQTKTFSSPGKHTLENFEMPAPNMAPFGKTISELEAEAKQAAAKHAGAAKVVLAETGAAITSKKLRGSGKQSPTEKYVVSMLAVYASAQAAGEPVITPAGEVNPIVKNCSPEILQGTMTLKTCLRHMGTPMFDDCVMDACLLAHNLNLAPAAAIAEASKENLVAEAVRNDMKEDKKELREEVAKADAQNIAEHQPQIAK